MSYTYPDKVIQDSVVAPFVVLTVVIVTLPICMSDTPNGENCYF